MEDFISDIGTIPFGHDLREKWKTGFLYEEWAVEYPQIFDTDDLRQARNQGPLGYHFFEWLTAIVLFNSTGYLSLVSKYQFKIHERKQLVIHRIFSSGLPEIDRESLDVGNSQYPDLLMYSKDYAKWFFCEVKGPRDRMSNRQKVVFSELAEITGKPISIIRCNQIKSLEK
jgi:hypothetical protein